MSAPGVRVGSGEFDSSDVLQVLARGGISLDQVLAAVAQSDSIKASLNGLFAPYWRPNTTYAAGDRTINPFGVNVRAIIAHTSGAKYDARNWSESSWRFRDPRQWPFRVDSPWNLPLATTARYEKATDTMTAALINSTANVPWINYTQYTAPVNYAADTDPMVTVTDTVSSSRSAIYRIPVGAIISPGGDQSQVVITPDGRFAHETFYTIRNSDAVQTVSRHEQIDLYGSGIGPSNGIHASGSSLLGGLIRKTDIEFGEIRHGLALSVDGSKMLYTGGSSSYDGYGYGNSLGYTWPATEQDYNANTYYTGPCPMGSFFAIPPWVDVESYGFSTPGLMIARALQRYGGYIVDRTGATSKPSQQSRTP